MPETDKLIKLKSDILTEGITIEPSAREILESNGSPITLADYASTSGITLRAANDVWINAPISDYNANFVSQPTTKLTGTKDQLIILQPAPCGNNEFPVDFIPVPSYYSAVLTDSQPITNIAASHGDRLRITPTKGCTFKCQFCDIPYEMRYAGMQDPEAIHEATEIALADNVLRAEHILISGGVPAKRDYDKELEIYRQIITNNPDIDVDIMMAPVPKLLPIERLHAIGARGLSINMELWNIDIAKRIMPGKMRLSREQYLNFIEKAVELFGRGAIRSALMVGLEPMEDTLRGVKALAERGADPMLSPFRPSPETPLANSKPPTSKDLLETYYRSQDIVAKFEDVALGPRCVPCSHNTMTIPDHSGKYYYSHRRNA